MSEATTFTRATGIPDREALLRRYGMQARDGGVDPDWPLSGSPAKPWVPSEGHPVVQVYPALRFNTYMKRYMDAVSAVRLPSPMAFLQFDTDGALRGCWGDAAVLQDLRRDGIVPETVWRLEDLGPNAVCVGLREGMALFTVGAEHYNRSLQKYALYFAPISMCGTHHPFHMTKFGGVAAVTPAEAHTPDHLAHVWGIAHDLVMNMHFSQTSNMLYERTGQGVLSVDPHMIVGFFSASYCSPCLFQMLDVESFDLYFKSVDLLIDPLPQNRAFWTIIRELQEVNEVSMTLSVQGKKVPCILSTDAYYQPALNARGVIFFITTPRQISQDISAKTGNSAIFSFQNIMGRAPNLKAAIQRGRQAAQMTSNVMLLGESGVGKDLFAQAIHNESSRRNGPFVAVNCGALPRDLIASELFGYDPGAFTGAKRQGNIGKFELANGGTIFLDEIGELPLDLQATLLRVVEEKRITRLGGNKPIDIDVKIISATNADIPGMIDRKLFRADLYYRLSTVKLSIPPLRDRGEDVVLLAEYFISAIAAKIGRADGMTLAPATRQLLLELPWQGNVRELQNLFECIVQLCPEHEVLPEHVMSNLQLPDAQRRREASVPLTPQKPRAPVRHLNLTEADLREAMILCGNNKSAVARHFGISLRTLYRKMDALGM